MYAVEGIFKMGGVWQRFRKEVEARSKREAVEKVYSLLGSNHHTKRIHIKIEKVEKVGEENVD